MIQEPRSQSNITNYDSNSVQREAGCLFALITNRRSVSRRNRASWFLKQLNKIVECDSYESIESDYQSARSKALSKQNESAKDDNPSLKEEWGTDDGANEKDIFLVSVLERQEFTRTTSSQIDRSLATTINTPVTHDKPNSDRKFLVTTDTRVVYLSRSIATSIVLDLSPSIVSVSSQGDCVFLDLVFDALKRVLHLLVRQQEVPSSSSQTYNLAPKTFVTVIAYTPFVVAKNNQVLIQNRCISANNIDQVLVEIWICLTRLTSELHELISSSCEIDLEYESARANGTAFLFPRTISEGIIRHPGSVLEDIYELGLFSASLMPRLSRLSIVIISDGLFTSTNNLNIFRLKSIAISFVSLCVDAVSPDASFGYTSYSDLMRFVSKSTQGVYITHHDLIQSSQVLAKSKQISLISNPFFRLFCWMLHSDVSFQSTCLPEHIASPEIKKGNCLASDSMMSPNFKSNDDLHNDPSVSSAKEMRPEHIAKFFCIDQSLDVFSTPSFNSSEFFSSNDNHGNRRRQFKFVPSYHDWRSYKQLERDLDADFEQVLSCLLREGYLIKDINIKQRETPRIVARLVLYWRHNLNLEQELTASYWNNQIDPFNLSDGNDLMLRPFNGPVYGDTFCEIFVHGSYSFLHNLYCDKKVKRRSEYRDIAYKQFRQLIDGVLQTHERLQYLSRFYRDASLSKVPSFLLHGNSLLYEQPHTRKLTSMIENVVDDTKTSEFQEYWQKVSCLDTKSWKNLMHVHTLRLVLEHDQPKHKNINCQNANGRYTHIQCRRAMGAVSNFIKSYASFALLEDSTYIRFIYNKDNDLRDIETSATKGFIVIRINKLLPIVVIYLMFTSGILDSHRVQIVSYFEEQLLNCKIRSTRLSTTTQNENILRSKTIYPSSESCCVLIRSPLERMLKVYSRNFVGESLSQNLALGLPGSCPYNSSRPASFADRTSTKSGGQHQRKRNSSIRDSYIEEYNAADSSLNRYNLVFGKYLYGIRVVNTIAHLPHDLVQLLASNVLAKISAILVNVRIKQGFHIAFNNSGILNLVVELTMEDHSHEQSVGSESIDSHRSTCLCQYMIFPPAITSNTLRPNLIYNNNPAGNNHTHITEKSDVATEGATLSGSLANSDQSYLMKNPSNLTNEISSMASITCPNNGEVKMIREYWIEQQYGISIQSDDSGYHNSLVNMRYSEVVDHLFLTDMELFECLLTYDILQTLCDKLSPFHELDVALSQADQVMRDKQKSNLATSDDALYSPTGSSSSETDLTSNMPSSFGCPRTSPRIAQLPSALIDGKLQGSSTRVPLIENSYKFSLVKFLRNCQQASLNVLLFRHKSDYFEPLIRFDDDLIRTDPKPTGVTGASKNGRSTLKTDARGQKNIGTGSRKMSVDANMHGSQYNDGRREHRSSYSSTNYGATPLSNSYSDATLLGSIQQHQQQISNLSSICSPSLNHLFLETLHKRLRQMHDKELRLTETDRQLLGQYLKRRKLGAHCGSVESHEDGLQSNGVDARAGVQLDDSGAAIRLPTNDYAIASHDEENERTDDEDIATVKDDHINWRCFMRKRNQENMMIVFVPSSLHDVVKWTYLVEGPSSKYHSGVDKATVCPIFVFRCSSTMLNERLLSFLYNQQSTFSPTQAQNKKLVAEADVSLHFGQPCTYLGNLLSSNDELDHETLPLNKLTSPTSLNQSDEKTIEIVHFRAFLRKIKNTVLKSRFSSFNDAYLSELFIHKDDLLYYIRNVDLDTQKKYHVSTQLKNLSEFIRTYEDYIDSLPREKTRSCNQLLNSILLQKCGIFFNQPIVRFNESNPLMKQLQDRKLIFFMRSNYKIELPVLEESLLQSKLLKNFVATANTNDAPRRQISQHSTPSTSVNRYRSLRLLTHKNQINQQFENSSLSQASSNVVGSLPNATTMSSASSSLTNQISYEGVRTMDMCHDTPIGCSSGHLTGSQAHAPTMTASAASIISSPSTSGFVSGVAPNRHALPQGHSARISSHHQQRFSVPSSSSTAAGTVGGSVLISPSNDSFILEAFRNVSCAMDEVSSLLMDDIARASGTINMEHETAITLRHEAHMAEVLRRKAERSESHQYRRVLKSKANYSQSHSAIDQALKRVDSLGRLEHFCLTPLLFSPDWRSKLAPVRDHTLESYALSSNQEANIEQHIDRDAPESSQMTNNECSAQQMTDERWHQMVCNNYIKEYEQYIQTLGFKSVQIRYPSTATTIPNNTNNQSQQQQQTLRSSPSSHMGSHRSSFVGNDALAHSQSPQDSKLPSNYIKSLRDSGAENSEIQPNSTQPSFNANPAYNTGYLIKFLNSGCLVFKVGFCKPYVYSMLYSIEGERFCNNSNQQHQSNQFQAASISKRSESNGGGIRFKLNDMTTFLDELDNIKVTMHLHSFTYDYHLRSMYSFISGRQMIFTPGYHLISFVDDFRKYYQKAPNYARNHLLSGEVSVLGLSVNGQQLYNYIITHNELYYLNLLEMSTEQAKRSRKNVQEFELEMNERSGHHASEYVLIELKREKVRYKDGQDSDIFDCGLLITKAPSNSGSNSSEQDDAASQLTDQNSLTLKYFLLLTNQRDLYPKLVHSLDDSITGHHRPIRLGASASGATQSERNHCVSVNESTFTKSAPSMKRSEPAVESGNEHQLPIFSSSVTTASATTAHSDLDDARSSNDLLLSSGEISGPPSTLSTAPSVRSATTGSVAPSTQTNNKTTAICDEEITYLGYFSSDEMDMLQFLQEKTVNLRSYINRIVKAAEIHYRRDYLWQKLMRQAPNENDLLNQQTAPNSSSSLGLDPQAVGATNHDTTSSMTAVSRSSVNLTSLDHSQAPLSVDELIQLLQIIRIIDFSALDQNLVPFCSMNVNWYLKLLKAFQDLKQSSVNTHRIYQLKASSTMLLFIDQKCREAFILLTIEQDRGSAKLSLMLKDHPEAGAPKLVQDYYGNNSSCEDKSHFHLSDLSKECQNLVDNFVNFCAAFMWSTLLTG